MIIIGFGHNIYREKFCARNSICYPSEQISLKTPNINNLKSTKILNSIEQQHRLCRAAT
jgi:hypothetical protein